MTKERLIELYNHDKEPGMGATIDSGGIYLNLCFSDGYRSKTEFIIDLLLPAVRDNEEWLKDFWKWMDKKDYGAFANKLNRGYLTNGLTNEFEIPTTPQMLEGYEKEYCLEILGKENV